MQLRTDDIIEVLGITAHLFVRPSKEQYLILTDEDAWGSVARMATGLVRERHDALMQLMVPPSFEVLESVHNNLFTGGMPLAALPIESLHQVWSGQTGSPFGCTRGLYRADCSYHVRALCELVGAQIPVEFKASPDHLSLLLELVSLFIEAGNTAGAAQIIQDHLQWLDAYADLLARRSGEALSIEAYSEEHRKGLEEGILFYRSLVILLSRIFRETTIPSADSEIGTFEYTKENTMRTREVVHV